MAEPLSVSSADNALAGGAGPPGDCDVELYRKHLSQLQSPESRAMYERTLAMCLSRPGGLEPTDQDMIYDLCAAEDVKQALAADIRQRGVTVETRNGRQVFRKENPSLARMCRYAELQRRIRADLRLTPLKRAPAQEEAEEETADAFEGF